MHAPSKGVVFRYVHGRLGTNWRLTEMQSSLGRIALGKLPGWVDERRDNAAVLAGRLGAMGALRVPEPEEGIEHSYYKFYAYVRPEWLVSGWSRDRIAAEISSLGVPCSSALSRGQLAARKGDEAGCAQGRCKSGALQARGG